MPNYWSVRGAGERRRIEKTRRDLEAKPPCFSNTRPFDFNVRLRNRSTCVINFLCLPQKINNDCIKMI